MKKTISIIGGGPAALLLAAFLDPKKFEVNIFEQKKSLGRKFLVAGKGGFNLTHSEPIAHIIERYTPSDFLKKALLNFDNNDFREWLDRIGIPTFVGSSKRIYPKKGIKPIEVLKAILKVLQKKKVQIHYEHTWKGWNDNNELVFNTNKLIQSDFTVFALGGGSWKITGSNGRWTQVFENQGVSTIPFQPSNCAHQVDWQKDFIEKHEGSPLKNIAITSLDKAQKGEVVITRFGLEGNAIYALSPQIRQQFNQHQKAIISIDLKPTLSMEVILKKMKNAKQKNITTQLRKSLKLSSAQIGLLKTYLSKEIFLDQKQLAEKIKNLNITLTGAASLDEAISTVGGVALQAVDEHFQLKKIKHHFCIGEMLDWDAPTGGYLLQACCSMGVYLARHLNRK